jgi:hypothetical protein
MGIEASNINSRGLSSERPESGGSNLLSSLGDRVSKALKDREMTGLGNNPANNITVDNSQIRDYINQLTGGQQPGTMIPNTVI